jgi:hypothetical protein
MLEPNPWEANWKEVGQGDPDHFFGIQDDAFEMEVTSPESILEKEAPLDAYAMDAYVERRFLEWNWSSNKQHQKDLQWFRQIMSLNF